MSYLVISTFGLHIIMTVMMLVTTESLKITMIPLSLSSVALNIQLELIIALPIYSVRFVILITIPTSNSSPVL